MRYEIKYILDPAERRYLEEKMNGIMCLDRYGRTTIRNIYFDTADNRLIRTSVDGPKYKEKLRIRSYKRVSDNEDVFVELKKKYDSVVYKRRVAMKEEDAMFWLAHNGEQPGHSQIENEIGYFRTFYKDLSPKVFISYEREAFFPEEESDVRITLDSNIMARDHDLSLRSGVYGQNIIDRDLTVLELKVTGAIPAWFLRFIRETGLHKTSFSKYGRYYMNTFKNKHDAYKGGLMYA